ncbi:fungal-specific transcription factor domain-containing protein [Aspergillus pseudoustus]|uniref:Fungal-specific transcription factor domain-containing protein n=1 Tax=Aspergillus pseudoustus TaxID=1810923 RepID=A0ABR4JFC4_9EURO
MQAQNSEHGPRRLIGRRDLSRSAVGKKRPVACRRCHAQKIRCSGERPCSKCRLAGCGDECSYVVRDRKVRVDESYLEQLIRDSKELRRSKLSSPGTTVTQAVEDPSVSTPPATSPDTRNPIMNERAWFESHHGSSLPIFINEVSCTAFATRLCQHLTAADSSNLHTHMPRMKYTDECTLNLLSQGETPWPSLARARLLVNTVLGHANPQFHLTGRKRTLDCLNHIYKTEAFDDPVLVCKYFALFALGEVCSISSSRSNDAAVVPGTAYYARVISLIHVLPERPSMAHIEALVILSLYSQFLNRWHSAYTMIGTALRLGLAMGLNHNIPREQCPDPITRESRVRLWWNIYIFDRFWALKLGLPVQVDDSDIQVDLPCDDDLLVGVPGYRDEFVDAAYQVTVIELARISSDIMRSIYSRRAFKESFLQREQRILIELQQWLKRLPGRFRLQAGGQNPKFTAFIHLQFNYCVILAIRPILLSLVDQVRTTTTTSNSNINPNPTPSISPGLTALCEACIHSARHSMSLCAEEWTRGSLPIFGYAFAQYIFTSSLVLLISSLLPCSFGTTDSEGDREYVKTASEMLNYLVASGNPVADDLLVHLRRVQACLEDSKKSNNDQSSLPPKADEAQTTLSSQQVSLSPSTPASGSGGSTQPQAPDPHLLDASHVVYPAATPFRPANFVPEDPYFPTAEDIRHVPPYQAMMQDFLGQSVSGIGLLEDTLGLPEPFTDPWLGLPLWDCGGSGGSSDDYGI